MANDDPVNRPAQPQDEFHGIAHAPVGIGAQHVTGSQILFPDGSDAGWVLTIGGSVAYITEADADRLGRLFLFGNVNG